MMISLATSSPAQTYTVLHSFAGGTGDGASPSGMLVQDSAGNSYGVTASGGTSNAGTIFEVTAAGAESVLYSFTGGSDGGTPLAGLFRDTDGTLYGTTSVGGDATCKCGTVFKLSPALTLTTLHRFTDAPDGSTPGPSSRLISVGGVLYGVTTYGGNNSGCSPFPSGGVVFKITKSGKESVAYPFECAQDGFFPVSLVRDAAGNLYGSAIGGFGGAGTFYKIDTAGNFTTIIDTEYPDGVDPIGHIIVDSNGNIHGVKARAGHTGCDSGCGSIYDVNSSAGTVTAISKFSAGDGGSKPRAGLVDIGGTLYGTTQLGGASSNCTGGCGVIYKLDGKSQYSALFSFSGTDGANGGELLKGSDRSLYGTTSAGGTGSCTGTPSGCGVIFKFTP
jgi:uncharacterized repeat protein (TIGR03803 family)